jgi:hypothetical protein
MGMCWIGLVMLDQHVPSITGWVEYGLGSFGIMSGLYMAATGD